MSAEITVADFNQGTVVRWTRSKWASEVVDGCRRAGHVFAYWGGGQTPYKGCRCLCGDMVWPVASTETTQRDE